MNEQLFESAPPAGVEMDESSVESAPPAGLAFGWKSKHSKLNKTTPRIFIPDYSAKKRKKKLQRMTYAPEFGADAADILVIATPQSHVYYLLFQNINTRFLYAFSIADKRKETLFEAIQTFYSTLLENGKPFHSLIADGEKGWTNREGKDWLRMVILSRTRESLFRLRINSAIDRPDTGYERKSLGMLRQRPQE
jgi:hypothetical protein